MLLLSHTQGATVRRQLQTLGCIPGRDMQQDVIHSACNLAALTPQVHCHVGRAFSSCVKRTGWQSTGDWQLLSIVHNRRPHRVHQAAARATKQVVACSSAGDKTSQAPLQTPNARQLDNTELDVWKYKPAWYACSLLCLSGSATCSVCQRST